MEPFIRAGKQGVSLTVHVVPRADKNEVAGTYAGALRIRLCAPPVKGAANTALVAFVAELLGIARHQVEIVSGRNSRHKVLHISGLSQTVVESKLGLTHATSDSAQKPS
jgi:hypothetical protein